MFKIIIIYIYVLVFTAVKANRTDLVYFVNWSLVKAPHVYYYWTASICVVT